MVRRCSRSIGFKRQVAQNDPAGETLDGPDRRLDVSRNLTLERRNRTFTSRELTGPLIRANIGIGMDGKGAWCDNAFGERLRKSAKHEEVYLCAYASVSEARAPIARYLDF